MSVNLPPTFHALDLEKIVANLFGIIRPRTIAIRCHPRQIYMDAPDAKRRIRPRNLIAKNS